MLLLYPGELYRLLGASSLHSHFSFASQRQSVKDKEPRRKGMNKKDTTIAMLAPDLLKVDPHVRSFLLFVLFPQSETVFQNQS
jgi:hypothetical protein